MWNALCERLTDVLPAWRMRQWGGFVALRAFHRTAAAVPAYADLLADLGVDANDITTPAAFEQRVPVLDAASYDAVFPPETRRKAPPTGVSAADGERAMRRLIESTLQRAFAAHRRPTLVLAPADSPDNVYALLRAMQSRCWARRWPVSFVAGLESTDRVISTVGKMHTADAQALIVGTATDAGALADRLAMSDALPNRAPMHRWTLIHDAGYALGNIAPADDARARAAVTLADRRQPIVFATDTAATLALRDACRSSDALSRDLFGDAAPCIPLAIDPQTAWVETIDGELCVTADAASPLIRYATGIRGVISPADLVVRVLADHGIRPNRMAARQRSAVPIQFNTPLVGLPVAGAGRHARDARAGAMHGEGLPSMHT